MFVIYSSARHELWRVGDASYMINGAANLGSKLIDEFHCAHRAEVLRACLAAGATVAQLLECDPGHERIVPGILAQHQYANRTDHEFGYGWPARVSPRRRSPPRHPRVQICERGIPMRQIVLRGTAGPPGTGDRQDRATVRDHGRARR